MPQPHPTESRAGTNDLLAQLRADRWHPVAFARFLVRAGRRSADQARRHPRALLEVTLLHAGWLAIIPAGRWRWTLTSWLLAATHLGLLERRRTLGAANTITLLRANLPSLAGDARWLPAGAFASDLLDGRLARCTRTETRFGAHADSLADAAFWTWYTLRHERSPAVRAAALAAWAAPVAAVTIVSIRRGHMVDPPAPTVVRPAAALQIILAVRAISSGRGGRGVLRRARQAGMRRCRPGDSPGQSCSSRRVRNRRSGVEVASSSARR